MALYDPDALARYYRVIQQTNPVICVCALAAFNRWQAGDLEGFDERRNRIRRSYSKQAADDFDLAVRYLTATHKR